MADWTPDRLNRARPEDVFPPDLGRAKRLYRDLSRRWHPDMGGDVEAFQRLTALYRDAIHRLEHGLWEGPNVLTLTTGKRSFLVHVLDNQPFPYGRALITKNTVSYLFDAPHAAVAERLVRVPSLFTFHDARMKTECTRYLPMKPVPTSLLDGRTLVQVDRGRSIRIGDLLRHQGSLEPKHVAWILSTLLNLGCYLSYTRLVHHDISLANYFVDLTEHTGALLGGWWFAKTQGQPVGIIPRRTADLMPFAAKVSKTADPLTDAELIRAVGRELLDGQTAPDAMQAWLTQVATGTLAEQYAEWTTDILPRSFGKRRYVTLSVAEGAIYGA